MSIPLPGTSSCCRRTSQTLGRAGERTGSEPAATNYKSALRIILRHSFHGAIGLFQQLDIPISLAFLRRFPSQEKAA